MAFITMHMYMRALEILFKKLLNTIYVLPIIRGGTYDNKMNDIDGAPTVQNNNFQVLSMTQEDDKLDRYFNDALSFYDFSLKFITLQQKWPSPLESK